MLREGPACHPSGFLLCSNIRIPASTYRSEWLRLRAQCDHQGLYDCRTNGWIRDRINAFISLNYGRKCFLCKAYIDIYVDKQPLYKDVRPSDLADAGADACDPPTYQTFHAECWAALQPQIRNKRRRLRYAELRAAANVGNGAKVTHPAVAALVAPLLLPEPFLAIEDGAAVEADPYAAPDTDTDADAPVPQGGAVAFDAPVPQGGAVSFDAPALA